MFVFVILLSALLVGCHGDPTEHAEFKESSGPDFPTEIRVARPLGKLDVAYDSAVVGIECGVCHTAPTDATAAQVASELETFHTSMQFGHGDLTCNSCHNPDDRTELRLANGKSLPFEGTMQLCAQCHGPQTRDYNHGSHGGMAGYWDTKRGPRVRNHCVNCHDPHAPAFPGVMPAAPPRDRFLEPPKQEH